MMDQVIIYIHGQGGNEDEAKEMLLVEDVDDRGFLGRLVEALYEELPERRK